MTKDDAMQIVHSMIMNFYQLHNIEPTNVLVDPRLFRELMNNGDPFGPLNDRDRTIYGLTFIEVYKPYPYLAVVAASIYQA